MNWVVIGEEKNLIKLVSISNVTGMLPKGSYITIEDNENKTILRVEESIQYETYNPSPMVVEMGLNTLKNDQKCQNIIYAKRIVEANDRYDGLINFIRPQTIARRSTQEEIDIAVGNTAVGFNLFLSTIHSSGCQILTDEIQKPINIKVSSSMFFHQTLICGKTGSGKTVATKYMAQYFAEELKGAVIAINVKDDDFLYMDRASSTNSKTIKQEWEQLNISPHGINNYMVYFPATIPFSTAPRLNLDKAKYITLDVKTIDPDSFTGLIRGISDNAAQNLPGIFRWWQIKLMSNKKDYSFRDFLIYFNNAENDGRRFNTMNSRNEEGSEVTLHSGTYSNIQRCLNNASDFFDSPEAEVIDFSDVLHKGKLSIINVAGKKGIDFGSILLRHLLHQIVEAKSQRREEADVPVLIIIDEVHQFYSNDNSKDTLGDIDTICRTGRSQEIGVIFSSQNPSDIPSGLSSVINSKIFFKTDATNLKQHGVQFTSDELEGLRQGYAAVSIHNMSQVKSVKFPLSLCGVIEKE